MINFLKRLRHNTFLKNFNFFWVNLGTVYRFFFTLLGSPFSINTYINKFGPYRFDGYFAFSNFSEWGEKNNFNFRSFVNACKNKSCVIDVGAHIGLMTIPTSYNLNKNGKIICFEPSNINKKYLIKHLKLNKINNVEVYDNLISNRNNLQVDFFERKIPSGLNSALAFKNKSSFCKSTKKTTTLDSFILKKKLKPDVIKIDVEGYEYFVMEGAKKLITRFKPTIFLSLHPRHLKELNIFPQDLFNLISELNYISKQTNLEDKNELILSPKC